MNTMNTKSVIIIGAGIGGLSVGAFLSKAGYKVTVLERNRVYGGYCQAFKRKDYLINPAVLRVGTKDIADRIDGYCLQLGIPKQEWNLYSESYQFGEDIHINMDTDNLAGELSKSFPEEKHQLHCFFEEMYDVFEILNKVMRNNMKISTLTQEEIKKYIPYLGKKVIDIISHYFPTNETIQV